MENGAHTGGKDDVLSRETALESILEKWLKGVRPAEEVLKDLEAARTDYDKDPEFVFRFIRAQIAQDLHQILEKRKMRPAELARQMGVARQWVNNILNESGNLTIKSVARVACVLGCTAGFRIAGPDEHLAVLPLRREPARIAPVDFETRTKGSSARKAARR